MYRTCALTLFAVSSIFCGPARAEDAPSADKPKHLLRYRFEQGEFVHYLVEHKSAITTRFGELEETAKNQSTTGKHYRVIAVDKDGAALVETVLDWVKVSAQFGDAEPTRYDSRTDEEAPKKLQDVAATIGKPMSRLKFAATGKLISSTLIAAAPKSKSGNEEDDSQQHGFLIIFPDEAVAVGEKWFDDYSVKVVAPGSRRLRQAVKMRHTYALESVKDGKATISMKTSVVSPIRDPQIRGQLIQRKPQGEIVFDIERGIIVSRSLTIDTAEIGVFGPKSSMRAASTYTETFQPAEKVAAKPE